MTSKEQAVLSVLQGLCAKREYCTSEISRKALQRCEGDAEMAARIVEALKADKFLSDARYACAFAREKAALTGWGPIKIRFALRAKGLGNEDIEAGLAEIDENKASVRLEGLLRARSKALEADPDARLKLIKFALSRGYEYDEVKRMLENLAKTEENS